MNLAQFAKECIAAAWDGCGIDGGEIEEIAGRCGLIVAVNFDPAKHVDSNGYSEAGDPWFEYTDEFKAALSLAKGEQK